MRNFETEKAKFEQDFEEMKTEVIERVRFRSYHCTYYWYNYYTIISCVLTLVHVYCELFLRKLADWIEQ